MEQLGKAKFCLSRRIEEYYFEAESFGENRADSEDDCSEIYNIIHQRALKRSRKVEIQDRLGAFYDQQQPAALNFTSDSVYASHSDLSTKLHRSSSFVQHPGPNSNSFNRRRFDVLANNVN